MKRSMHKDLVLNRRNFSKAMGAMVLAGASKTSSAQSLLKKPVRHTWMNVGAKDLRKYLRFPIQARYQGEWRSLRVLEIKTEKFAGVRPASVDRSQSMTVVFEGLGKKYGEIHLVLKHRVLGNIIVLGEGVKSKDGRWKILVLFN